MKIRVFLSHDEQIAGVQLEVMGRKHLTYSFQTDFHNTELRLLTSGSTNNDVERYIDMYERDVEAGHASVIDLDVEPLRTEWIENMISTTVIPFTPKDWEKRTNPKIQKENNLNKEIINLLKELNDDAQMTDKYCYGLPTHDPNLVDIVKNFLNRVTNTIG